MAAQHCTLPARPPKNKKKTYLMHLGVLLKSKFFGVILEFGFLLVGQALSHLHRLAPL